jgi:hypothetical protein
VAFSPSSPDHHAEYGAPGQLVDATAVRAALDSMPAHLRVVLVEIYLAGRPVDELADLLAVSEDTIKAHAHQSLQVMRQALRRRLEDDQRTTVMNDGAPPSQEPNPGKAPASGGERPNASPKSAPEGSPPESRPVRRIK